MEFASTPISRRLEFAEADVAGPMFRTEHHMNSAHLPASIKLGAVKQQQGVRFSPSLHLKVLQHQRGSH